MQGLTNRNLTTIEKRFIEGYFDVATKVPSMKKMTMKAICDRAEINHQSVYNHFGNLDEALKCIEAFLDQDIHQKIEEYIYSGHRQLITFLAQDILPLIYAKKEKLKIMFGVVSDGSWTFFLQEQYEPLIKKYIYGSAPSTPKSEFICGLVVRQIVAVIAQWLLSKKPEPLLDFQKVFAIYLSTSTTDLLASAD